MNLQPYRVVVTRDKELKSKVIKNFFEHNVHSAVNAAAILTLINDYSIIQILFRSNSKYSYV